MKQAGAIPVGLMVVVVVGAYVVGFVLAIILMVAAMGAVVFALKWLYRLFKDFILEYTVMMTTEQVLALYEESPKDAVEYILNGCPRDSMGNNKLYLGRLSFEKAAAITKSIIDNVVWNAGSRATVTADFEPYGLGNKVYLNDSLMDGYFPTERLLFSWDNE